VRPCYARPLKDHANGHWDEVDGLRPRCSVRLAQFLFDFLSIDQRVMPHLTLIGLSFVDSEYALTEVGKPVGSRHRVGTSPHRLFALKNETAERNTYRGLRHDQRILARNVGRCRLGETRDAASQIGASI
jgi:hypothetical protein